MPEISKTPSILKSASITGAVAAILATLVLLFPWWLGWIPVLFGIAAFVIVILRNPEYWARRTFASLLLTYTSLRLIPHLPGILVSTNNLFVLIAPSNSHVFDIVILILLVSLLAYDVQMRGSFRNTLLSIGQFFSPQSPSTSFANTSGNAQLSSFQNLNNSPVTINYGSPPVLTPHDSDRVFSGDFREGNATVEPVASFDSEIDRIATYVKDERSDIAIDLFITLLNRSQHLLTKRQRYRVSANLGMAYEVKEDYEKAARFYHEAVGYQPEDEKARCFEATAYFYSGDPESALRLANSILETFPFSPLAWAIRIRCTPANISIDEIEKLIPPSLASDIQVLDAITQRAADLLPERAEEFIKAALKQAPESPQLKERLASVTLQQFDEKRGTFDDPCPLTTKDRDKLQDVVKTLDYLITKRQEQGNTKALSRLRFNRGTAHRLLGNSPNAVADMREAWLLSPNNVIIATRLAFYLWKLGSKQESLEVLRLFNESSPTPNSRWLHANLLCEDGEARNVAVARALMEQTLGDPKSNAQDIAAALERQIEILCEINCLADAQSLFQRDGDKITVLSRATIGARLAALAGDQPSANEHAKKAIEAVTENTPREEVMRLSLVLDKMKRFADALSIVKRIRIPGVYSPATPLMLEFARKCDDHSFILETCQRLREHGVFEPECLENELGVLIAYDAPDKAIEIITSALSFCPDVEYQKVLRCRLFQIGAMTGRLELFQTDLAGLPDPETARPSVVQLIVSLLVHAKERLKAAEYAYRALRARSNQPEIHKAMIAAKGIGSEPCSFGPPLESVSVGCAVQYRAVDTNEVLWCVLEQKPQTDSFVREVAPDSPLGMELRGKRIGDNFFLRKNSLQDREAVIVAIVDVFTYRALDSLQRWEDRFQDSSFVQSVQLTFDQLGKPDFGSLFRQLDRQAEERERLDGFYKDNVIPAAMIAEAFGSTVPEAVAHLGGQGNLIFRCCRGTEDEANRASVLLATVDTCVIDSVALATLWMTGSFRYLEKCSLRFVVTEGTMREFRMCGARVGKSGGRSWLSKQNGRYVFREMTGEDAQMSADDFGAFMQWMNTSVERIDGLALLDLPPANRKQIVDLVGKAIAESIATARRNNWVLWTDDFATAELAQSEFGVGRIWTESLLQWCHSHNQLRTEDYESSLISLIDHGYEFTPMFPQLFVVAGKQSDWNPDFRPLKRFCGWFANPNLKPEGMLNMIAQILLRVWREAPLITQRTQITRMIAIEVRRHASGRDILKTISANVDKIFPIDVLNAQGCKKELDEVLDLPEQGKLILLSSD